MCPFFVNCIIIHSIFRAFIAYHNANKQFHVTHDSKHDSMQCTYTKKMREGKRTKSAIGILQLPFCLRLFYINWPSSTHQKRASRLNKNWTREVKRDVWMRMWKVQCEKMTAINHSCWASFKYKSISIFHFYALEPSKHPICSSLPYPYGTLSKRRGYHHADSRHIAYWSAYRICHFLTAISRMQSLSQLARKNNNARVCWSSIKNVHTRCKLIFSLFCYHAVIIPAVVLWFFFTCSQLGKFAEIFVKKRLCRYFSLGSWCTSCMKKFTNSTERMWSALLGCCWLVVKR